MVCSSCCIQALGEVGHRWSPTRPTAGHPSIRIGLPAQVKLRSPAHKIRATIDAGTMKAHTTNVASVDQKTIAVAERESSDFTGASWPALDRNSTDFLGALNPVACPYFKAISCTPAERESTDFVG